MKPLFFCLFFILVQPVCFAQKKQVAHYLTNKDLTGIWQIRSHLVGSGLNQHFHFFKNGIFEFNPYSAGDEVRTIFQLKGRYRLSKNELYLTITSKMVSEGPITAADAGIDLELFQIDNTTLKEIFIKNPKEIEYPYYIDLLPGRRIKINNKIFYKTNESEL